MNPLSRLMLRPQHTEVSPLDPPASPEESAWWSEVRPPIRRLRVLQFGLFIGGPIIAINVIKHWGTHFTLASGLAYAGLNVGIYVVFGSLTWLVLRKPLMRLALVEKRIRDGLTREAALEAGNQPPDPLP